jgi:ABC-2 type transport system ATP-binding protein
MAVIDVQSLHKRYRDHVAVHDVSFSVEDGEIFGILGPNGAGKTTTVECIEGLRSPEGGRISVLGLDPQRDRTELRQVLGIQLQASELPEKMRVGEAVELFAAFYPDPADPDALLDRWSLAPKRKTAFGALSGGQKQRLSIVLALVGNPRVAILDELTTGLDPQARRDTWSVIEQIRDSGVTVVLVTHFMEEAERLCDRLAVIDAGRVVAVDSPAGLVASLPGGQRLRFRTSTPVDDGVLTALPGVASVRRSGTQIEVTGSGDLLQTVTSELAHRGVVAVDLRLD